MDGCRATRQHTNTAAAGAAGAGAVAALLHFSSWSVLRMHLCMKTIANEVNENRKWASPPPSPPPSLTLRRE